MSDKPKRKRVPPAQRPTSPHRTRAAELGRQALELRCQGHSVATVADRLGVPKSTAFAALKRELEHLREESRDLATTLRDQRSAEYDAVKAAMAPLMAAGDQRAADVYTKAVNAQVALWGTAAAKAVEVTGKDGGPLEHRHSWSDLMASAMKADEDKEKT